MHQVEHGFERSTSVTEPFNHDERFAPVAQSELTPEQEELLHPPMDPELVQRAQEGDRHAFASIFDACTPYLTFKLGWTNRDDLPDVLQETYIKAAKGITTFEDREIGGIRPWLSRIAQNTAIDRWRREQRIIPVDHQTDPTLAKQATPIDVEQDVMASSGLREVLARLKAYDDMSGEEGMNLHHLVTHVFIGHMSYKEYAERNGISQFTVNTRVHRMRKLLRSLQQEGVISEL